MKKIFGLIGVLCISLIIWFSFIKTYDHQIKFEVNLPAGTVYHMVLDPNSWDNREQNIDDKATFERIKQSMTVNETAFDLLWEFENLKDTTSRVHLYFKNREQSLLERYSSLIKQSTNLDSIIEISKKIKIRAEQFSKQFSIRIEGIDSIHSMTYLYVQNEGIRSKKAGGMMRNNTLLFQKKSDSLVRKNGQTFVKVDHWDLENDSIYFKYAFPVEPQLTYPTDNFVKVDTLPSQKALKASFRGNYSISDQAWIALYHYAKRHQLELKLSPVEIFYNNPMHGGNDRLWRADIFMPIKE